jgi:hypothetical protein
VNADYILKDTQALWQVDVNSGNYDEITLANYTLTPYDPVVSDNTKRFFWRSEDRHHVQAIHGYSVSSNQFYTSKTFNASDFNVKQLYFNNDRKQLYSLVEGPKKSKTYYIFQIDEQENNELVVGKNVSSLYFERAQMLLPIGYDAAQNVLLFFALFELDHKTYIYRFDLDSGKFLSRKRTSLDYSTIDRKFVLNGDASITHVFEYHYMKNNTFSMFDVTLDGKVGDKYIMYTGEEDKLKAIYEQSICYNYKDNTLLIYFKGTQDFAHNPVYLIVYDTVNKKRVSKVVVDEKDFPLVLERIVWV